MAPPGAPLRRLFAYKSPFDLKTQYQLTKLQKDSRGAATVAKLQFGGQNSLFRHPAGTGNWRRSSPSSPPTPLHQPAMFLKEICPRGNNKVVIIYIFMFMINVYISCYNCINRNISTCVICRQQEVPSMPLKLAC